MSSRGASLEIRNVDLSFGGIAAIKGVSFEARASELLAMVGPNGAGKTALLNCINGIYRPNAGEILLDAQVEHEIVALFYTEPVGPLQLRGFFQPVPAFRLSARK